MGCASSTAIRKQDIALREHSLLQNKKEAQAQNEDFESNESGEDREDSSSEEDESDSSCQNSPSSVRSEDVKKPSTPSLPKMMNGAPEEKQKARMTRSLRPKVMRTEVILNPGSLQIIERNILQRKMRSIALKTTQKMT